MKFAKRVEWRKASMRKHPARWLIGVPVVAALDIGVRSLRHHSEAVTIGTVGAVTVTAPS